MKILLIKNMQGALIPASEEDLDKLKKYQVGATISADITQMRNAGLHKKWFTLVRVAFGLWVEMCEMPKYKDQEVQPNFEKFREDLTILAGYSNIVVNINLEARAVAKSIGWGNMSQDEFESLYQATINVILGKVLANKNVTEDRLREMCSAVLEFA